MLNALFHYRENHVINLCDFLKVYNSKAFQSGSIQLLIQTTHIFDCVIRRQTFEILMVFRFTFHHLNVKSEICDGKSYFANHSAVTWGEFSIQSKLLSVH